jgi:type IV pilus assembly protein PilA
MLFKLNKMLKNKKGFTLVEVIVVAVIVAILAAVAIPLYIGYVNSSRQNVVDNAAGSLASFCGAAKNSSTPVTAIADVAAGVAIDVNPVNANVKWIVPEGVTATVTATNVTVKHVDDATKTKTVPY